MAHSSRDCRKSSCCTRGDEQRRAWLLSRGRSSFQGKHYDRYSYLREKQEGLEKWAIYLDELILNDQKYENYLFYYVN